MSIEIRKGVWFRVLVFLCMIVWGCFLISFTRYVADIAYDSLHAGGRDMASLPAFTRNVAIPIIASFDPIVGRWPWTWVESVVGGIVFFGHYLVLLVALLGKDIDRAKRRFLYAAMAYVLFFLGVMLCIVIGLLLPKYYN